MVAVLSDHQLLLGLWFDGGLLHPKMALKICHPPLVVGEPTSGFPESSVKGFQTVTRQDSP